MNFLNLNYIFILKYNIGLDIGTTSVGWAVVECNSNEIIRKGNKALWGVRLFEEAQSAEERRGFRSSRKRYDRRRKRIKLLRQEFENEINKIDPLFYTKLNESFYNRLDDKNKTVKISKEENNLVKIYNKKYPTIYHLREELINNPEKKDIRLVYLAIHHIIKYRGNFLYQGSSFNVNDLNVNKKLRDIFENIDSLCEEFELDINSLNEEFYDNLELALCNSSKSDRKIEISKLINNIFSKNFVNEFIKLISGTKFNIAKLLNIESEEEMVISFKGSDYEEKYSIIEKELGNKIDIIDEFKELYDMIFLKNLFGNNENNCLSSLMVRKYQKHKDDLRFLKDLLNLDRTEYNKFFKDKGALSIYSKYLNNTIDYVELIKEIDKSYKKILDNNSITYELNEEYSKKQEEMQEGAFLPKISDTDNGKYPYQLNKDELIKIIENQGQYYSFLLEKINGDYKIIKLLEFRIPYYVGPLNNTTKDKNKKNPNAWLIKNNEKVVVTPYNFEQIIDKEQTAEKFITRMISHCTYLLDEYAIPNESILYSKFKVMNELKQIKINDNKIPNNIQHRIFSELFLKDCNITEKKFINYLKQTNEYSMYQTLDIKGYSADKKFANNMKSYIDFFGTDGIFNNTDYSEDDAEEIIRWITIFEDKSILEDKVRKKYSKLTEKNIKAIISKNYSGWSNLSKKLLRELFYKDKSSGINKSIMDLMYETPENFIQILNNKEYNFQKEIDKFNKIDNTTKINYGLVENLATSPSNKRGIYQALKIVEELVDYIGYKPENIMIEMARSEDNLKTRKDSRKDYLLKLYAGVKNEIDNYKNLNKELNSIEKIDDEKLFLYFIQEGKSLYSGTPLDINDLSSYEVDHIIPRTLIKDNSIDNKALVLKTENQNKAASFVVPSYYGTPERKIWWNHLKKLKLISDKKYNNLCRSYYSEKDIEGFINRQLVETRQITKHVANILKNYYKETNIVYLHADLTSNYRQKFELFKYRQLNDYHHAHDAYLAVALGSYIEIFNKNYAKNPDNFNTLKTLNKRLYENKKYKDLNYGYIINSLDNELAIVNNDTGEILFDVNEFNKTIEKTLYRNDILISKKTEIRTGEFYNQTKSKKGNKGVSLKDNMPTNLYGSYTSLNPSYAVVVKYIKKNKEKQKMIGIPIYIDIKKNEILRKKYIANLLDADDYNKITIIKDKIPFYSILNWDGQLCSLVGATANVEVCNCTEFNISKNDQIKWKHTLNRLFNSKNDMIENEAYNNQLNEIIDYVVNKIEKEYKLYTNLIDELKGYLAKENLDSISLETKEKTLLELFKLLKFNSACANLKVLEKNASMAFGKKHNRIIEHATIINKSVTGLRTRRYEF